VNRLLSCALLVVALAPTAATAGAPTQTQAPNPTVIGTPPSGQNALEFIGTGSEGATGIMPVGYFTHIDGLPDDLLFSDPSTRTEATARFTFAGVPVAGSRTVLGTLASTSGTATFTFYFNATPGANFNDPSSFTKGQPIAAYAARTHSVLHILVPISAAGPGKALISAAGDVTQNRADPFALQGSAFVLGKVGQRLRVSAQGDAVVAQVNPPQASVVLAGELVTAAP
jgi:hypothetical protein